MLNLLIIARKFFYIDTGDKEPDAWEAIVKLLNEKTDPRSYKEFRVFTGQSAEAWYNTLQADGNVHLIWWKAVRSLNNVMKSNQANPDTLRLALISLLI